MHILRMQIFCKWKNVLRHYGYRLGFCGDQRIWQCYTVMTLLQCWKWKKKRIIEMLSVTYIVFLCGLQLLSAACDYQLVRGRARITDTFQMFVFSMHFSKRSRRFLSFFSQYARPAKPSTALGRTCNESSKAWIADTLNFLPFFLSLCWYWATFTNYTVTRRLSNMTLLLYSTCCTKLCLMGHITQC